MQLIYAYLDIKSRNVKQEINFNSPLEIHFDLSDENVVIKRKNNYKKIDHFYGENIDNMDVIVGRNGYGKSTLLDIIGLNNQEIMNSFDVDKDSWILIYNYEREINNNYYLEAHSPNGELYVRKINSRTISPHTIQPAFYSLRFSLDLNLNASYVIKSEDKSNNALQTSIYYLRLNYNPLDNTSTKKKKKTLKGRGLNRIELKYDFNSIYKFMTSKFYKENLHEYDRKIHVQLMILPNTADEIVREFEERLSKDKSAYFISFFQKYIYEINIIQKTNINELINNLFLNFFVFTWKSFNQIINSHVNDRKYKNVKDEFYSWIEKNYSELVNSTDQQHVLKEVIFKFIKIFDKRISSNETRNRYSYFGRLTKIIEYINMFSSQIIVLSSYRFELLLNHEEFNDGFAALLGLLFGTKIKDNSSITYGMDLYMDGFSSGEAMIINIFSSLYSNFYNGLPYKKAILLLDEPDCTLHPEWARQFVNELRNNLLNYKDNYIFDVIMTTHSPLPISDFFKDSVHLIGKDVKTNVNSFCGNIGELMVDNFFLERPFGEFAYNKVKEYSDKMKGDLSEDDQKEIEYLIDNIGDEIIKKSLYYRYNDWLEKHPDNIQYIKRKLQRYNELKNELLELGVLND